MHSPLLNSEELELWALLGQTRRAMSRVRSKELRQYDISMSKSTLLNVIWRIGEKATPALISRSVFLEPHSVSELLSRMEKEGLVLKIRDLDKKNQVRIVLTDKGRDIYLKTLNLESIRRLMSPLSNVERLQLKSCLEKLRDISFKELGTNHQPMSPI